MLWFNDNLIMITYLSYCNMPRMLLWNMLCKGMIFCFSVLLHFIRMYYKWVLYEMFLYTISKYFIYSSFWHCLRKFLCVFLFNMFLITMQQFNHEKKIHFPLLLNLLCHFWKMHWGNLLFVPVRKVTDKEYLDNPCKYY